MEFVFYDPKAVKGQKHRRNKLSEEERAKSRDKTAICRKRKQAKQAISLSAQSNVHEVPKFHKLLEDLVPKWCTHHSLDDPNSPPIFYLTEYASVKENILAFQEIMDEYGRFYGCIRLVPFVDGKQPKWNEKPGLSADAFGKQRLKDVHQHTFFHKAREGNGVYPHVLHVTNKLPNTWRSMATWQKGHESENAERFTDVAEAVSFLRNIADSGSKQVVLYGTDQEVDLINMRCSQLGFVDLGENVLLLDKVNRFDGIHSPYLYFGWPGSAFSFHTEDWFLPSANHLIAGEPKVWYIIPPACKEAFEDRCKEYIRDFYTPQEQAKVKFNCPQFVKHERLFFTGPRVSSHPRDWEANNYRCYTVKQEVGHLLLIWPGAYHSGVNLGHNLAEAANFGFESWINLGSTEPMCTCNPDSEVLKFDMGTIEEEMANGNQKNTRRKRMKMGL